MNLVHGSRKALCLLPLLPALLMPGVGVVFPLAIVIAVLFFVPRSRLPTLALREGSLGASVAIGVIAGFAVVLVFGLLLEPFIERVTDSRIDLSALADIEGDFGAYLILLVFGLLYLRVGRRLLPVIVAHMTVNAFGITLLYLGVN